jgi:Gpi18-like mannosyltransferase
MPENTIAYMSPLYPARAHWLLYALLYVLLLLLTPAAGFGSDVSCWTSWATQIGAHGLNSAYDLETNNYNPLYQYVLWTYAKLAGSPARIVAGIHCLKAFTLLFDFGGAILAVRYFGWGDGNQRFLLSLLFLLNLGFLYNTVVWEQVDAIVSTLAFAAVVQALRQRPVSSALLFVLAINTKSQAIIFLPPLLLLWAPQWWLAPRHLGQSILLGGVGQLLILAPFIWGGTVVRIAHLVYDAVGYFPFTSVNCYNIWVVIFKQFVVGDFVYYAGLTYRKWGLLSFMLASTVVLLPLGLTALHKLRTRTLFGPADYQLVLLSVALIPLVFCFFNTQMHERYWHPALLLLGAHAVLTRRYVLFMGCSLAYFMNLEAVIRYLGPISYYPNIFFRPKLVAGIFGSAIVGGVWQLYRQTPLGAAWQLLRQPSPSAAVASGA